MGDSARCALSGPTSTTRQSQVMGVLASKAKMGSFLLLLCLSFIVSAQTPPWRGAGPTPCTGSDGGYRQCPPAPRVIAIRAGHLFDSRKGQLLARQVVVLTGERITAVGPENTVKIPAGAQIIDLSKATVLPGLIDAHTHMFNQRGPKGSTEGSMLVAVENVHNDLLAGFTAARDMSSHGNGYADITVRDAINEGRIDGPRYQVSTLGIVWGATPPNPAVPENPLASKIVRSVEEARAAVREQISHGADWIKLFPSGAYSFDAAGKPQYVLTYPLPVVEALVEETIRVAVALRRADDREEREQVLLALEVERHGIAGSEPGLWAGVVDGRGGRGGG